MPRGCKLTLYVRGIYRYGPVALSFPKHTWSIMGENCVKGSKDSTAAVRECKRYK